MSTEAAAAPTTATAAPPTEGAATPAADAATPETPAQRSKLESAQAVRERLRQESVRRREREAEVVRERDRATRAEQQAAERAAELEKYRAEASKSAQLLERAKADPFSLLEQMGVTPDVLAAKLRKANTPEGDVERIERKLMQQLEEERGKREAIEKRLEERERETQQTLINQRIEESKRFITKAISDETKFPILSQHPDDTVIELVDLALTKAHRKTGRWYSIEEALEYLEENYRTAPRKTRAGAPKDSLKDPAGSATDAAKAATSRSTASEPDGYEWPTNIGSLSDEAQREEFAKYLKWKAAKSKA